jgi:hypothetical protein
MRINPQTNDRIDTITLIIIATSSRCTGGVRLTPDFSFRTAVDLAGSATGSGWSATPFFNRRLVKVGSIADSPQGAREGVMRKEPSLIVTPSGGFFASADDHRCSTPKDPAAATPGVQFLLVKSGGPAQRRSNSVGSSTSLANRCWPVPSPPSRKTLHATHMREA